MKQYLANPPKVKSVIENKVKHERLFNAKYRGYKREPLSWHFLRKPYSVGAVQNGSVDGNRSEE